MRTVDDFVKPSTNQSSLLNLSFRLFPQVMNLILKSLLSSVLFLLLSVFTYILLQQPTNTISFMKNKFYLIIVVAFAKTRRYTVINAEYVNLF